MTPQWLELLQARKDYYPEFLSGWTAPEQVGYRASDFMLLDLYESAEPIGPRIEWLPRIGVDCAWLKPAEVCEREPNLSPVAFRGGIRVRDEAVIDPISLWEALGHEVDARGVVRVTEGVVGFGDQGNDIQVETGAGTIRAGRVVIAAGSCSAELAQMAGLEVPVCPDKGQMLLLRGPAHMVNSVLFMPSGGCGSVLERAPGLYVLGSSEEWLRPVADNTVGVIGTLLSRLSTVLPAAAEWSIERMWAGFRSMSPDLLPLIGFGPDPPVHCGHGPLPQRRDARADYRTAGRRYGQRSAHAGCLRHGHVPLRLFAQPLRPIRYAVLR